MVVAGKTAYGINFGFPKINIAPPDTLRNIGRLLVAHDTTNISKVGNILIARNGYTGLDLRDGCFCCTTDHTQTTELALSLCLGSYNIAINGKALHRAAGNIAEEAFIGRFRHQVQVFNGKAATVEGAAVWTVSITNGGPLLLLQIDIIHQFTIDGIITAVYLCGKPE